MRTAISVLMCVFVCGCAAHTERAVQQTERISELAQSSAGRFERIAEISRTVEPDVRAIESEATHGRAEQVEIQHAAAAARRQIVHTQDIRSPWAGILTLWGVVFLAALGVMALVYLGAAPMLRKLVSGWVKAAC